MKYCSHCGAELNDEAAICTKCGCAVDEIQSIQRNSSSDSWNAFAIAGFVLSFLSVIIGLILSIIGYKQIKETGEKGKELALAGIIISSISTAIVALLIIILVMYMFGLWLLLFSSLLAIG